MLLMLVCTFASAQMFSYDFEQLNVGDPVAATIGDPWTTWNNAPGSAEDGLIADEQAVGNRSLKIDSGNDVVLKLGDKTTGAYRLSFDMFVPEGKEAYFNVLHEFAGSNSSVLFNMWLNSESNGNLINGMSMSYINIVFPLNEWNTIIVEYYVDDALTCIKINDEIVCLGMSFKTDHPLAAIDFWPCSNNPDRNGFYIDNVIYEEIEGPFALNLTYSPNEINANLKQDTIDNTSYSFSINNDGNTMARVCSWVDYGIGEDGGEPVTLHYDTAPYDTYGNYNNNPYIEIGIEYSDDDLIDFNMIGRKITGMQYYVPAMFETGGSGPIVFRLYKYIGFGNSLDTELLVEKEVGSFDYSDWLNVNFDEAVPLKGHGILATVGFQQVNNGYPISIDAGPASIRGNLVRLNGGNWSSINIGNNNIRLMCEGQPLIAGWVNDSYESWGDIFYIGDDKDYPITFNTNGLELGNYHALLHLEVTNDDLELTIPLNLTVSVDDVVDVLSNEHSVYPNPTSSIVKIEAENIQNISIYNMLGEMVFESSTSGNEFEYDFSNNESGVYLVRIETEQGVVTKRVTVK